MKFGLNFGFRFGYSGLFFERRKLLELMFNNLTDKTPVYTSKKVVCIEQDATRAVVTAADGTRVSADLVVGADGVRSVVRQSINDSIAPLSTRTDDPNCIPPFSHSIRHVVNFSQFRSVFTICLHIWNICASP